MTVVNYSFQDIWGPGQSVFVGTEWFKEMLADKRLHDALWRQLLFSGLVLLIEIPLGILLALSMPKRGWGVSVSLVIISLPLLIPWNTIGTIWIIFTRPDIGLFGATVNKFIAFDHTARPLDAWITVMLMEIWHWTPLVTLLAYSGLQAIPEAYYQAARIDAASPWATFKYIQLPKMRGVLTIAILLRFMDSFSNIRRAVRTDRRRPRQYNHIPVHLSGQNCTFAIRSGAGWGILAHLLSDRAAVQLSVLSGTSTSWKRRQGMKIRKRTFGLMIYFGLLLMPIYWMLNMSLRTNADILSSFVLYPKNITFANYIKIFTDPSWYSGYINSILYVSMNMVISLVVALPAAYAFSRYHFLGDKHMFFLAAHKPHGAGGSVRSPLFSTVFFNRPVGYTYCRGTGALSIQCAPGGLDIGRLYVRNSQGN